jgi:hypothetical protein
MSLSPMPPGVKVGHSVEGTLTRSTQLLPANHYQPKTPAPNEIGGGQFA